MASEYADRSREKPAAFRNAAVTVGTVIMYRVERDGDHAGVKPLIDGQPADAATISCRWCAIYLVVSNTDCSKPPAGSGVVPVENERFDGTIGGIHTKLNAGEYQL